MQVEGIRYFRVKAVAEMFDVSPNTIYRAIESGKLRGTKFGEGQGTLRVAETALAAYVAACEADTDGALTPAQADGLACVVCEVLFLETKVAHRPVGRSHTGSQVFACTAHVDQADSQVGEVA